MTVISSNPDRDRLEITVVAEFEAPAEKVWNVWEDPRKLEQWWGPPTWPATFHKFDFSEGGEARFYMTGPEGNKAGGYWRFRAIEPVRRIQLEDGFADEEGNPNEGMPAMIVTMTLEETDGRTTMTTITKFNSLEDLDQVIEMGIEEGTREAMGQIDALL